MSAQVPQNWKLAVLLRHHPMDGPTRTGLYEERVDAAAMIADNHAPFTILEGQAVRQLGSPQQPRDQVSEHPEHALSKRVSRAREAPRRPAR